MIDKLIKILSENKNNSQGLLTGNAGLAIFFYHVFQQKNNASIERIADNLLDEIFEFLEKQNRFAPVFFDNGLAGIGWCVEYLVKQKFCEGNTDHILEDIDNAVFKIINEQAQLPLNLQQGLIGYLFYVISRLKNENSKKLSIQINRELLIKIINQLDETVPNQFQYIGKEIQFDLLWQFPVL
jgi:lantibiotic modifying enzyme